MGRKNTILIFVAILIVIGAFALAEYRNSQNKEVVYNSLLTSTTTSSEIETADSDNDGLKDWEEILLGTDINDPDTDKDGTSDGKEAAAGRNPLVKGPNDKAGSVANSTKTEETLNPTEILARDFFARYMELRQVGLSKDKDSQQELIGTVLKNGLVIDTPKTYSTKDIIPIAANSKEAIKKYGNDVGNVFKKYAITDNKNEANIAKESLEKENPELLKEIDPIIMSYKNILAGLIKTGVPSSMSTIHLDMINGISGLLFSAESLRKIDKDPLSSIQGAGLYLQAASALNKAFNNLKSYLDGTGIIYDKSEGGSFFIPNKS